ncbi:MAG: 23S rRNA (pseudouridine(1915)-N(3))-methyltransferase RlmH [Rhodospirillales bacterium]|jgi:23S rRNA (pseudouridine1915-N3)-methyltransferase|nr:23S rRNA (pseudouridine(1915)-N(3))-methyltransferase RlmH [Rhodospirillaceae bacterium]MDP6426663.1 23S rRNA (pseudouridine(1915)-N(3))-methyltransferase RlmH [Rhodospirillales bacterium]MDP6645894.1 23S rRNA (pseudouridine(1915)-N(3))-methyltransferase RlmH [Rhodospirillales bacterium]MDP6840751.1 23S rRNA (pseudouridine(1915)-N(3))-methyltransferase RlmH [Rhodospirillales bacterium]
MQITVAAVGRMKSGPAANQWEDYRRRLTWPVKLKEVEERKKLPAARMMAREAELLAAAVPGDAFLIALDPAGKSLSSTEFASQMGRWMNDGQSHFAFVIGGADGLAQELLGGARFKLSLGPMTWPHMLARVMLIEQLYRAQCILTNHPYHR